MSARDLTAVVHLAGFATGAVLYLMLGAMSRRRLSYVDVPSDRRHPAHLLIAAALLGAIWNVGAMLVYASRDFATGRELPWLGAMAYTALGFLPAVVVHLTLNRSKSAAYSWLLVVAYAGSGIAGLLHFTAAARGDLLSPAGLLFLTVTDAAVLAIVAAAERRRPGFQRSITAVALAAFAVSALHLSRHPGLLDPDPWPIELIGHHASLPLVLAILYQEYRFAFADLFLKRALALLALVGLVSLLYATFAAPLVDPHAIAARRETPTGSHLLTTGVLLLLWIATALAYPLIQRRVFRFVDRIVLRRVDYRRLRAQLSERLSTIRTASEGLDATCALLTSALGSSRTRWNAVEGTTVAHPTIGVNSGRSEARVVIPTAVAPSYEIVIEELGGGRTLLSDDLVLIEGASATLARRIDEIRLEEERREREQREQEVMRLATEAELRALRAQLNPHFLFNALATLGHLMQTSPERALGTLYRLTGLLRAVLRRTNGQFVALRDELDIVESYLAIERERFEERLTVELDVPADLLSARIPTLLLQPLVENAVKHGIAPLRRGGSVSIHVEREGEESSGGVLHIRIIDTGKGIDQSKHALNPGLGLANIESRLRHYFGNRASLHVRATVGGGTTVEVRLPWIASESGIPALAS